MYYLNNLKNARSSVWAISVKSIVLGSTGKVCRHKLSTFQKFKNIAAADVCTLRVLSLTSKLPLQ